MDQLPGNSNKDTVARLENSKSNNRVTELSPVPLNKVIVEPRHQLAQELDKDMVEHQTVNRSQPTLTTQTPMATLSLRHLLHPTNKRFENSFPLYFFAIVISA